MDNSKWILITWLALTLVGSGKFGDPYRPDIPVLVNAKAGLRWSAHIPTDKDGIPTCGLLTTPKLPTCYVWIPDAVDLSGTGVVAITNSTAESDVKSRDATVDVQAIKALP